MLTDEQLTEIWRRLQSIELTDLGEKIDGEFYLRIWPNNALHRPGSVAQGEFIANAPADIEALLTEVKRLRGLLDAHTSAVHYGNRVTLRYTDKESALRIFKDVARESTELPPVIEDQLDSGIDE